MKNEYQNEKLQQILNDAYLHHLMRKVIDILLSYSTQDPGDFSRPFMRFNDSASIITDIPTYDEPSILFVNGQPEELVTPWGGWECFDTNRSGCSDCYCINKTKQRSEGYLWDIVLPMLTRRLGLKKGFSWIDECYDHKKIEYTMYTFSKVDGESLSAYRNYCGVYLNNDTASSLSDRTESTWETLETGYALSRINKQYQWSETNINEESLQASIY